MKNSKNEVVNALYERIEEANLSAEDKDVLHASIDQKLMEIYEKPGFDDLTHDEQMEAVGSGLLEAVAGGVASGVSGAIAVSMIPGPGVPG